MAICNAALSGECGVYDGWEPADECLNNGEGCKIKPWICPFCRHKNTKQQARCENPECGRIRL